jgi:hypothetical protein
MRRAFPRSTPWDLIDHPELAILEALDDVLHVARFAIIAAYPAIADPAPVVDETNAELLIAHQIVDSAQDLQSVLRAYRRALDDRDEERRRRTVKAPI